MSKKVGRPRKETDRRDRGVFVRFSDEEIDMIKDLMYDTDFTKSEVVRRAVKMLYYSSKN